MGDVISTNLDDARRGMITARTSAMMADFGRFYEQQYAVALFNSVRFEIEGGGSFQTQLLHRKDPLKNKSIFSGALFQYLEESKKWRSRFLYVGDSYNISLHESKAACDRGLHSKGVINCAGYRALTSMEEYLQLLNNSLGDIKAKVGSSPVIKCPTQFPLILWHPYARHYYFCVLTEKEQKKWHAVFQDCVRHTNNGLSEECKVSTPAFTDALRLYRQSQGHYGSWDLMCGNQAQILANLVMETLHPELKNLIVPRLKGKLQQKQKDWMLITDAVYRQVLSQIRTQYEALVQVCEVERPHLDAALRTDMDQIITSKEHVSGKIRALLTPRIEQFVRSKIQPYIHSILEALMEPTSRGFSEVRDILFRELVEVSKNTMNDCSREKLGEYMEKISMLAFHPVKMQSCYEKMERLNLEGLQQRCDVSCPSVFIQRAQILMRQKYDYDSSTVRKKFFREALLQIIIPYMLKELSPSCSQELPKFNELIFEDFSRFLLVENIFEEVVLQSVTKDIMMAVKEAAVQRRHNLYRDSMVLTNSDPNLHLLGEDPIDWAVPFGGGKAEKHGEPTNRKRKQIVSMIHLDGMPLPYESCLEVPGVEGIPEENEGPEVESPVKLVELVRKDPGSPDSISEIRDLINPVLEVVPSAEKDTGKLTNGVLPLEEGDEVKLITVVTETVQTESPRKFEEDSECAFEKAIQQIEIAIQEEPTTDSDGEFTNPSPNSSPHHHDDSGFQSPANENVEEVPQADTADQGVDHKQVMLTLVEGVKPPSIDFEEKKLETDSTTDKCLL
ncbi:hypothetical protein DNTS_025906 [Danionella cerebrum]|uniref:PH domain-containing protein n=1 Tax=Danionella cerebrum TaxID=2873325 RepID=A0A553MWY9_9TELE|nr:hypothetical protein DNTS_025906 [Danionella translucida]